MNPADDQLQRLFRAAAGSSTRMEFAPAFGIETRVLAAWRSNVRSEGAWNTAVLLRGLLFASVIVALSLWPALQQRNNSDSENLQFADSTVDNTP